MKGILCSQTRRNNIVKMSILPEDIDRFNTIPIRIAMAFFTEVKKNLSKIYMELQKMPNSQSNTKKEQSWRHCTS